MERIGNIVFIQDCGALPFLVIGEGNSLEEAKSDFLAVFRAMSGDYGINSSFVDFDFVFDLSGLLVFYSQFIKLAGIAKLTGINEAQLSQYACGTRKASEKTAKKIQTALQDFGRELVALNL